jgi:hypothetical protein
VDAFGHPKPQWKGLQTEGAEPDGAEQPLTRQNDDAP